MISYTVYGTCQELHFYRTCAGSCEGNQTLFSSSGNVTVSEKSAGSVSNLHVFWSRKFHFFTSEKQIQVMKFCPNMQAATIIKHFLILIFFEMASFLSAHHKSLIFPEKSYICLLNLIFKYK